MFEEMIPMEKNKVLEYVRKNLPSDYNDVALHSEFNGYEVWEPLPYEEGLELGWPPFLLIKGDAIRRASSDEIFAILGIEWDRGGMALEH